MGFARIPDTEGILAKAAEQARCKWDIVIGDLEQAGGEGRFQLSIAVPLLESQKQVSTDDAATQTEPAQATRDAALLILRVTADEPLSKFVNVWPTHSASAETLRIRQDGEHVEVLSTRSDVGQRRYQLQAPGSRDETFIRAAAQGPNRVPDGMKYRGVPVLATRRTVTGTPWILVVKMDQNELRGPIRSQARSASIITTSLMLGG